MNLEEFKSGKIEDRYEYKAFLPETVCHAWNISDVGLTDALGRADRALGALNAYAQLIPDIDFFISMYVAKEATQSSKIEGTQTNIEDAFKAADDLVPGKQDDWGEVQNYIRAINQAIQSLETLPLSNRLLRETHKTLLSGVRGKQKQPGEFRKSQNWIGVSLKDAVFVPPHHEHLPYLLTDLEKFLNDDRLGVHPLIRIAIAHYQFETIHPFLDGNGRLGRLMISLYLASTGLLSQPALYLSDYFERHKTSYVDHLMAVREGNHIKQWLVFFLTGIEVTANQAGQKFKDILALKGRLEAEVLPKFSARRIGNANKLLRSLYGNPVIDALGAKNRLGTAQNTASSLINDFEANGILTEITGLRRNRLFIFKEYVDLFKGE